MIRILIVVMSMCLLGQPDLAKADAAADIEAMLHEFLAGSATLEAHKAFWSTDLIYTSSSGTRTNKAEILASMQGAETSDAPSTVYSAEEVDINLYDDAAVVAFKLVGTPTDSEEPVSYYFNTGTLVLRDGRWQVVAWQATRIPADDG